jgi:hypothetical protein
MIERLRFVHDGASPRGGFDKAASGQPTFFQSMILRRVEMKLSLS